MKAASTYKLGPLDYSTPQQKPKGKYGIVRLEFLFSIFDTSLIDDKVTRISREPIAFEELEVYRGYVLEESKLPKDISDPVILEAPFVRDRGLVFVDRVGIQDR